MDFGLLQHPIGLLWASTLTTSKFKTMDGIIINQFEENDMDAYKLLHDFNLFEDTFLPPYSADANANTTNNNVRNLVQDHHLSDHISPYNAETMVEEMTIVDEEIPHLVEHDEEEAVNANQAVTPPTNFGTGNHDCNAEQQDGSPFNDFDLIDWQCVFDLVNSGTVSQEGEPAEAKLALTPFNDCNNNFVNNNLECLEKFLNEETTQEIIHGTNCKTEPILKRSCGGGGGGGGDNNVKKWVTRKRYKKGSPEDAQRKEEYKIKNRVAAARSFERKQAYIRQLELQCQNLRKENAIRKNWLQFHSTVGRNSRTRRGKSELRRSISASTLITPSNI